MTKRQRDKLERLACDPPALARFLKMPLLPHEVRDCGCITRIEATALESPDADYRANAAEMVTTARWRVAEGALWRAAHAEKDERLKAANLRVVRVSVGMPWRNRLFDLLEHDALRASLPTQLFAFLLSMAKAQADYDAKLRGLREAPNASEIAELRAVLESLAPPSAMQSALDDFLKAGMQTLSARQSQIGKGKGKRKEDEGGGRRPTTDEQQAHMHWLRKHHREDRALALSEFSEWGPGYSKQHAGRVAINIGWQRRKGGAIKRK